MRLKAIVFSALGLLLLISCGPTDDATQADDPFANPAAAAPHATATQRTLRRAATGVVAVQPSAVTPVAGTVEPAPQAQIDLAIADLMARRSVTRAAITVLEARSLMWPNAGAGCPQPGVEYLQVPVDGVFIRLAIDSEIFHYHGRIGKAPFLCTQR